MQFITHAAISPFPHLVPDLLVSVSCKQYTSAEAEIFALFAPTIRMRGRIGRNLYLLGDRCRLRVIDAASGRLIDYSLVYVRTVFFRPMLSGPGVPFLSALEYLLLIMIYYYIYNMYMLLEIGSQTGCRTWYY